MCLRTIPRRENRIALPFLVGVAAASLIVIPTSTLGFQIPKLLVFSLTAFICMLMMLWKKEDIGMRFLMDSWYGRFLIVFILTLFASLIWSVAPMLSIVGAAPRFMGILTYAVCISLGLYSFFISQNDAGRKVVLMTIVLSNALVVIYGLLQIVGLDPLASAWRLEIFLGRTFSSLGQPNALGAFLLLTMPFVWVAGRGIVFKVLSVCNVIVLLSTSGRAALLGLVVMIVAFVFVRFDEVKRRVNKRNLLIAASILIILIGVGWQSFSHRFSAAMEGGRSGSARMIILEDTVEMIKARPFGYGLDAMGISYPRFMNVEIHEYEPLTAGVDRAHSMPLDLLVTLGPVGLASYYGFLLLLIVGIWKVVRLGKCAEGDPAFQKCNVLMAGFLSLIGYSVSLLFGFEMIVTAAFFWIVLGLVMGVGHKQDTRRKLESLVVFVMMIITAIASIVFLQLTRARLTMQEAEQKFLRGNITESLKLYEDAADEFSFDRVVLAQAAERSLGVMEGISADETKNAIGIFVNGLIDTLDRLTGGKDGMNSLLKAWIAVLEGDSDRAEAGITRARELMPASVTTERIAMRLYELLDDADRKEDAKRRLIRLLPSYWQDQSTEKGRILWKENGWLSDVVH